MAERLTTLNINVDEMMLNADQKKNKILAIANGEIQCSYQDAMREVNDYGKLASQIDSGYLFLAAAKYLIANRYHNEKHNETDKAI